MSGELTGFIGTVIPLLTITSSLSIIKADEFGLPISMRFEDVTLRIGIPDIPLIDINVPDKLSDILNNDPASP